MPRYQRALFDATGVYIVMVLLFVLDASPQFDIVWQPLKSLIYHATLPLAPFLLAANLRLLPNGLRKGAALLPPLVAVGFALSFGVADLMTATRYGVQSWNTMAVRAQHRYDPNRHIEIQTQDTLEMGHNRRVVDVTYVTPLFMWVSAEEIQLEKLDRASWSTTS